MSTRITKSKTDREIDGVCGDFEIHDLSGFKKRTMLVRRKQFFFSLQDEIGNKSHDHPYPRNSCSSP